MTDTDTAAPLPHHWTLFAGYHLTDEEAERVAHSKKGEWTELLHSLKACFAHSGMGCVHCGAEWTPETAIEPCKPSGETEEHLARIHKAARGVLPPILATILASLDDLDRMAEEDEAPQSPESTAKRLPPLPYLGPNSNVLN